MPHRHAGTVPGGLTRSHWLREGVGRRDCRRTLYDLSSSSFLEEFPLGDDRLRSGTLANRYLGHPEEKYTDLT